MSDHFGFDTTSQYCGYSIKRTKECNGSDDLSNPRYVVTKGGCNVIPGAMFPSSPAQARQCIAALELAKIMVPFAERNDSVLDTAGYSCTKLGHAYHMLMKLAL